MRTPMTWYSSTARAAGGDGCMLVVGFVVLMLVSSLCDTR